MHPPRARRLGEDVCAARTLGREPHDVVLDQSRIAQASPDHVRMRIPEQALEGIAIGATRERLALAQRRRSARSVLGSSARWRAARPVARARRVANQSLERKKRVACRLLAKTRKQLCPATPV